MGNDGIAACANIDKHSAIGKVKDFGVDDVPLLRRSKGVLVEEFLERCLVLTIRVWCNVGNCMYSLLVNDE